jgi:putative membrane protein
VPAAAPHSNHSRFRYWEGRKLWSTIALVSRSLAQIIWLHIPNDRKPSAGSPPISEEVETSHLKAVIEKRSMVNLIQAFSVSLKHLLRGEPGIYYEDLYPLICFLPRYASAPGMGHITPETTLGAAKGEKVAGKLDEKTPNVDEYDGTLPLWWVSPDTKLPPPRKPNKKKEKRFDPESVLPQVETGTVLRPARNPPRDDLFDYLPIFIPFRWIAKAVSKQFRKAVHEHGDERTLSGKRKHPNQVESNVPLEIWYVSQSNCLFPED